MSDTKTYPNITQSIFDCIKSTSVREHHTVYEPSDGVTGTATTKIKFHGISIGTVVLDFALDTNSEDLTYTIKSKPSIVTDSEIWNGLDGTVAGCRGS